MFVYDCFSNEVISNIFNILFKNWPNFDIFPRYSSGMEDLLRTQEMAFAGSKYQYLKITLVPTQKFMPLV